MYFCGEIQNITDMIKLRVKEICKGKKITLFSVAEKIGVSKPSISNIANGKIKPSFDTIEKLANALDVPVWQLFASPEEVINKGNNYICPVCGTELILKQQ